MVDGVFFGFFGRSYVPPPLNPSARHKTLHLEKTKPTPDGDVRTGGINLSRQSDSYISIHGYASAAGSAAFKALLLYVLLTS